MQQSIILLDVCVSQEMCKQKSELLVVCDILQASCVYYMYATFACV